MSECPICKDKVKDFEQPRTAHLVLHRNGEGHVHVHGDLDKKEQIKEMLEIAGEEIGVGLIKPKTEIPKEIVFHNKQRIGDMLMFTCAIRDFKAAFPDIRVNVIATAPHIWDFNPAIDRTLVPTEQNTVKIGPTWLTNKSNALDWHFANAYRISIEQALGVQIPQGESRPDIYFTEEEYNAPRVIESPYWIICVNGEKGWGCKMYPFTKWQEFVNQNKDVLFVQIGAREDQPPRLKGDNVIDFVGHTQDKHTGIRDLYKLFLNAEGSIGLVSFHMHLSGALCKPAIIVAGGREPVSFTRYPGHAYLSTDGMLPCSVKACWHCGIETCVNPIERKDHNELPEIVPKCVDIIGPEDITRALNGFYAGGRLKKDMPSEKPKMKKDRGQINVVKVDHPIIQSVVDVPKKQYNTFGLQFGRGALLEDDWRFIEQFINDNHINTVLEFGSGLSTLLFSETGVRITSYETMGSWIDKVRFIKPELKIRKWDGKNLPLDDTRYDLAFVDGPSGPANREESIKYAAAHADVVIVHDGNTEIEKQYMKTFLTDSGMFDTHGKTAPRCYLFTKKKMGCILAAKAPTSDDLKNTHGGSIQEVNAKPVKNPQSKVGLVETVGRKFIKIVTTARGWGGQARSITTIMKMLLKGGHRVEFIPFRNSVTSAEMRALLKGELKNVTVTETYDTLRERCDVLFMYADDYIWEFNKPEIVEAFSGIGAERKVMMLNYRRGAVGEVGWTKGWDKYMFLNSTQEAELLRVLPGVKTKVLPPCTDLTPFFEIKPDYNHSLRIMRHSSQGDTKFDKDGFVEEVTNILLSRQDAELYFLPGPSFLAPAEGRIQKFGRTADPKIIASFLAQGNLFWYSLPKGYMDMGPRVILEAMAAGLPVIADNWGGAKDRVSRETGWLCDEKKQHVEIIKQLTVSELRAKGQKAKERAAEEFVPERWIEELFT